MDDKIICLNFEVSSEGYHKNLGYLGQSIKKAVKHVPTSTNAPMELNNFDELYFLQKSGSTKNNPMP